MKKSETEGTACDNLNGVSREGAWHHGKWKQEGKPVDSKIYPGQRMGSAPGLDVGGEEGREIKDESQVSRKSAVLQPQLEHRRKVPVGRVDAENSFEFEVVEHLLVYQKGSWCMELKLKTKT